MKKMKYFSSMILASLLLFQTACEPIEDRLDLENTTTVENVKLSATASTKGGNEITLKLETKGVYGTWDYKTGVALSNEVTFLCPFKGNNTFTFTGTLGAEFFQKTVDIKIDVIDHEMPAEWELLAGSTEEGKTWVFDGTGGDGGLWWYMCPANSPDSWQEVWWNAGGTCCPPKDVDGKMHFDLNGNANYKYYSSPDAEPQDASFSLDTDNKTLKINEGVILGAEDPRGNPESLYTIISLTEDQLILYSMTNAGGTGWVWVFKAE